MKGGVRANAGRQTESRCAKPAAGYKAGHLMRVQVSFDEETFAQIRKAAASKNRSFAEQVRLLSEWALEDHEV